MVTAAIDGKPSRFVLDTGAERTMLSTQALRRLDLPRDEWVSSAVRGIGGIEIHSNAVLRSFDIGRVPLRRRSVNPALSLAVAPMPWLDQARDPVAGLLGADYLSSFDIELDLADRTLDLVASGTCPISAVPWALPHVALHATRPRPTVLLVPVQIDGTTLMAQLDTGASVSLITQRGAMRLATQVGALAGTDAGSARGIGRQAINLRRYHVAELRFGPIVARDINVAVGTPAGGYPFDMILGLDVLQRARLRLSYANGQVLVAVP